MNKLLILLYLTSNLMASPLIVYGTDDRAEVYKSDYKYQQTAKSVAAQFSKSSLNNFIFGLGDYKLEKTKTLEKLRSLGQNERFAKQQTGVECSAFLISPTIIATAGHCIQSISDCEDSLWVFDYMLSAGEEKIKTIPKDNVVSCKRIIKTVVNIVEDFALIEINEPQEDRPYLELENSVTPEQDIYMLGFPSGIPMKVANNAKVINVFDKFFSANLDAFSLNSGSPVLSEKTDKVIGILVRGSTDYFIKPNSKKYTVNVCNDQGLDCLINDVGAQSEEVSRVSQFKEYLP
jgi:V8-like Glu-specific endopeptidase